VAIGAVDLDCVSRFAVKLTVAMGVLAEVAVDAVHSLFQVNVLQMHGFAEFLGVIERNDVVFFVEQISLAVFFIDSAEYPAVAVEVGELGVIKRFFELGARDLL
jgi:hypothetical protein